MTRQEAIAKFKKASGDLYGSPIIDGLEALGLLKFEEEKKAMANAIAIALARCNYSDSDFVKELEKIGYKIVKAD